MLPHFNDSDACAGEHCYSRHYSTKQVRVAWDLIPCVLVGSLHPNIQYSDANLASEIRSVIFRVPIFKLLAQSALQKTTEPEVWAWISEVYLEDDANGQGKLR